MEFTDWINWFAIAGVCGIMVSMGLSLTPSDFARVLKQPKPVAVGLVGQLLLLPAVAFAIALFLGLPEHMAIGLMIIAACPGGATSNAFSFIARGDVALSISLTAVSSVIAFVTVPLVVNLSLTAFQGSGTDIRLSFLETAVRVFLTTAFPVAVGMITRYALPKLSSMAQKPLFGISLIFIILPSISLMADFQKMISGISILDASAPIILNLLMIAAGFALGRLFGLGARATRTLSIEVGVQNFGLVLVIVFGFLQDHRLLLPGLIYLPSMLITGGLLATLLSRRPPDESPPSGDARQQASTSHPGFLSS